jgi:hypothetical protein
MKKLFTIAVAAIALQSAFAQSSTNDSPKARFGLKVTPSVNWMKPDGKLLSGNGAVLRYGGGLVVELRLTKSAAFQTGLQLDVDGGKIKYNNGGLTVPNANNIIYYYYNTEDRIEKFNDKPLATDTNGVNYFNKTHTTYILNQRTYKMTYVTIPLNLKLKTKEIGMMTYFGQVGVNASFRWRATATDELTNYNTLANEKKTKIDITKDMNLVYLSLNAGLGAEINIAGSTSIVVALNYMGGFTSATKKESEYLMKRVNDANGSPVEYDKLPQKIKTNAVVLTLGILF